MTFGRRAIEVRDRVRLLILLSSLTLSPFPTSTLAATPIAREKLESRVSRAVKTWNDAEWSAVAGPRAAEIYEVMPGDTLYGISQRLFNDPQYWPKIWALNNGTILNAHRIFPKMKVAFAPGTNSSPPSIAVEQPSSGSLNVLASASPPASGEAPALTAAEASGASAGTATGADRIGQTASASVRSEEWKRLAQKQPWESTEIQLPPTVDRFGFDETTQNLNLREWPPRGLELDSIPATDKFETLGRIIGARRESAMLGFGDIVYIEPEAELQVGELYTITSAPSLLKSPESDRSAWSYSVDGTVRILGVKDGVFLGRIEQGRNGMFRNAEIVPFVGKLQIPAPIPGPGPIDGVLFLDPNLAANATGQFRQVFVDRGSEDGIQPGMVFRAYTHTDPMTGEEIFENDTVINGDILILRVSNETSLGMVLGSYDPILEDSALVLLTDVSDVMTKAGFRPRTAEELARDKELDDLEKVPPTDGLSDAERKELEQLEGWKGNPPSVEKALENQDLRELTEGVETPDAPPPAPVEPEGSDSETPPAEEDTPPPAEEDTPPPAEEDTPPPAEEDTPPPAEEDTPPPTAEEASEAPSDELEVPSPDSAPETTESVPEPESADAD